eukprot:scaffold1713_cov145-Skeletonema_menzelii.AAC.3
MKQNSYTVQYFATMTTLEREITSCTTESSCGLFRITNEYHELLISYEGPLHPASDYYTKKHNKKTLCIRLPSSASMKHYLRLRAKNEKDKKSRN